MTSFNTDAIARHGMRLSDVFVMALADALADDKGPEIIPEGAVRLAILSSAARMVVETSIFVGRPMTHEDVAQVTALFQKMLKAYANLKSDG